MTSWLTTSTGPDDYSLVIISRSFWRKAVVTVIAATGFVSLYEVTALDSRYAARHAVPGETMPLAAPGARLVYSATAYCKGMLTTSGVAVQRGIAAGDPELLPVGSVVEQRHGGRIFLVVQEAEGRRSTIESWEDGLEVTNRLLRRARKSLDEMNADVSALNKRLTKGARNIDAKIKSNQRLLDRLTKGHT